jgi:hypothetical protein
MNDLEKIKIIKDFIKRTYMDLGIKNAPEIIITNDKKWCQTHRSFGSYEPSTSKITVYLGNRNLADFLRTLGHELVHHYQKENDLLYQDSGETGSEIENEANSKAGVLLRNYGKINNAIYENKQYK